MTRMLRPDDIKAAAEWYSGVSVRHVPGQKSSARVSRAKRMYWASLTQIGLSHQEVADIVGMDRSGVSVGLRKSPEPCHVEAILERAREQVACSTI